jgi:chromosome segregation ATPase
MSKVKPRKSRTIEERKEVKDVIELKNIKPVKIVVPETKPALKTAVGGLNPGVEELFFEIDQIHSLETRVKRKDTLLQEQQKKIGALKLRITRLEEEARNRNRTIASYQSELIQFSKDLEDRQQQIKTLEAKAEKICRQIEEVQKEKQTDEKEKSHLKKEITNLQAKFFSAEKEISGLRTELKQKAQDTSSTIRELKETKNAYKELQESFDVLLAQNTGLDRQVQDLKKIRQDMEGRYTKTLDNLKAEVRIRQGECSKLLRELQDLKREREELERLIDGIELKVEMLTSNNASLQRKLDKTQRQKAIQEEQLNSWLVRIAMAFAHFFRRWSAPEDVPVSMDRGHTM